MMTTGLEKFVLFLVCVGVQLRNFKGTRDITTYHRVLGLKDPQHEC